MSSTRSTIDELLRVLASSTRRQTVRLVAGQDESVSVAALADALGERDRDGATSGERDRAAPVTRTDGGDEMLQTNLYHVHLPKLADADVVTYERETEQVSSGPQLGTATAILDAVGDECPELSPGDRAL